MSDKWLSDEELSELLGKKEEEKPEKEVPPEKPEKPQTPAQEEKTEKVEKEEVVVKPLVLEPFMETEKETQEKIPGFETLEDIPVDIRVVLGSTEKTIEEILDLKIDSVVKLSKMAGELVDIFAGDQLVAKGEIVIIDDKFGVLINEILTPQERIKGVENKLRRQKQ